MLPEASAIRPFLEFSCWKEPEPTWEKTSPNLSDVNEDEILRRKLGKEEVDIRQNRSRVSIMAHYFLKKAELQTFVTSAVFFVWVIRDLQYL